MILRLSVLGILIVYIMNYRCICCGEKIFSYLLFILLALLMLHCVTQGGRGRVWNAKFSGVAPQVAIAFFSEYSCDGRFTATSAPGGSVRKMFLA